ncbi:MAG: cyclic nucleotide-binding domain-containing protein [Acidimicrobiaceae bacterium]|nr:cyclic nucleotide-binding domain-containing protein [Acidimicrobiaceae bacterium]MBT6444903.1 cyclic nucleotide-binding domain-containing protein [Acidimicrobiaceae bacterium]
MVTGRLQLTAINDGAQTLDVSVGRGDIVGELGIIEQAPRSAAATATRDSTLARLSEEAFETLTGRYPKLMLQVFRKILTRVMRPNLSAPEAGMIAVAVLSPNADVDMVRSISREIESHGPTLFLDREQVSRFFNRRGVVDADAGTAEQARHDELLHEADVTHRWVVLETDPTLTTWSRRALRSADRVVLVTSPFPDEREHELIRAFTEAVDTVTDRELWMVQTNQVFINRPTANKAVIATMHPDRILQHHRGLPSSTARLGRLASGTATGVALSGGGGRSFAQIGALRALAEAGHNLDVVTRTSMGSVVASMFALVADPKNLTEHIEEGFRGTNVIDYTLPLVSLTSGKGLTEAIIATVGPILIEELTLPFCCLSTNLTTAQLVEHRRGSVADALRASVSLPGVFPPVVVNGELLVDGGVMENLPVGPLVRDSGVGTVLAVDVAPPNGPGSSLAYGSGVSGGQALRHQVSRNRASYPGIANTVMSSMLRSSARARNDALADDNVDMYLSVNLRGVKLLDFDAISEIAERGYRATGPPWNASRACERGRARFMVGPGLLGSKYWRETDHTTPQQSVR